MQSVVQKISAFYSSHTPKTERDAADKWLKAFQRSNEAWALGLELLTSSGEDLAQTTQMRYIAAQTLHQKIRYDFRELSDSSVPLTAETLLTTLVNIMQQEDFQERPLQATLLRLCQVLSALVIQIPEWTTVITDLHNHFKNSPRVFLELMSELPDEIHSKRIEVNPSQVRQFVDTQLKANANNVLAMLNEIYQANLDDVDKMVKILKCLKAWMRFGVEPTELACSPLVDVVFKCISPTTDTNLFATAVDTVVTMSRTFYDMGRHEPMIRRVFDFIQSKEFSDTLLQGIEAEDDDVVRGITNIITDIGEGFTDSLLKFEDIGRHIIQLALHCTRYRSSLSGVKVSSISFYFWLALLGDHLIHENKSSNPFIDVAPFKPIIQELVGILVQTSLPFSEEFDSLPHTDQDDERFSRRTAVNLMLQAVEFVGVEPCLQAFGEIVRNDWQLYNAKQISWQKMEASLFAIRSMYNIVSPDEKDIISEVMNVAAQIPDDCKQLQATALSLFSYYSRWLSTHPDWVQSAFDLLVRYVQLPTRHPSVAICAIGIKNLLFDCGYIIKNKAFEVVPILPSLHQKDQLDILAGLARVASVLDLEESSQALEFLIKPSRERLEEFIADPQAALAAVSDMADIVDDIDATFKRLTTVITEYKPRSIPTGSVHPTVGVLSGMWGTLKKLLEIMEAESHVAECVCRLLKHCLRSLRAAGRNHVAPEMFKEVLNLIAEGFFRSPQSPYLYCASVCMGEFYGDEDKREMLLTMFQELADRAMHFLMENFEESPEVVEDFFDLVTRSITKLPDQIISSRFISKIGGAEIGMDAIITCAVAGMKHIVKREAIRSVVFFLDELTTQGTPASSTSSQCTLLSNYLNASAPELISAILRCMAGRLPHDRLLDEDRNLVHVMYNLSMMYPNDFQGWVSMALQSMPQTPAERTPENPKDQVVANDIKMRLYKSLFEDNERFSIAFEQFSVSSRRYQEKFRLIEG
eukprot:TRINITY_DN391_c0_g1_i2.p1 TRINITY_DN391_c0_g1~~TRINITY_DN391_c0_g1_i2.p1  ORF type:complete len:979 (+),score=265.76 TRINITY_DN391_c0_g1_i2:106-3042(+)